MKNVWNAKRQFIWLVAGISAGTFIVYRDSYEDGHFVPLFFVFMETLLLIIISTMFYIYSKKKR
jgi:hypothetical protein